MSIVDPDLVENAPFEGPEKLLEIWFSPEPINGDAEGLRKVPRETWEEMLDIVKCKVLSVIRGNEVDAYLLSESSFFIFPHKLILKTCGTTLNLLGLPRILSIAKEHCSYNTVYRVFYSRKSFMFPERQHGPHREWTAEVEFLDKMFDNGAAYTVGKVNGDHWLLYMTSPPAEGDEPMDSEAEGNDDAQTNGNGSIKPPLSSSPPDYTIEILMSKLSAPARRPFFFPSSDPSPSHAKDLSSDLGLASLFPADLTTLDPYAFEPCGYSANALVDCGGGEGYYTIHVTPEEGWSYASFECNVPMSTTPSPNTKIPDLETLIQRVIHIFQPGHLTLTLFISSSDEETATIDAAQKVFSKALGPGGYSRTNKINYEFGGYDLAFASFEKNGKRVHAHA